MTPGEALALAGGGLLALLALLAAGGRRAPGRAPAGGGGRRRGGLFTEEEIAAWPEVQALSAKYGWPPSWLANAISKESGGDTKKTNSIGAAGLLQLLPKYQRKAGFLPGEFVQLNREEQLWFFDLLYLEPHHRQIKSKCDLRLVFFLPAALKIGPDDVAFAADGYTDIPEPRGGFRLGKRRVTPEEWSAAVWAANEGRKSSPRAVVRRRDIC